MSTTASPPTLAPAPALVLLARGALARLALWPAMRAAVAQGWGGPHAVCEKKRVWIASGVVDLFDASAHTDQDAGAGVGGKWAPPDAEDVALALLQAMEEEFEVLLEDDSVDAVAADIVRLWAAASEEGRWAEGEGVVREWEERVERVKGKEVDVQVVDETGGDDGSEGEWESEDGEDEGEDGEDEAPMLVDTEKKDEEPRGPVVDEDGFTMVQKKGKGRR